MTHPKCPKCGDADRGPWLPDKGFVCERCDRLETGTMTQVTLKWRKWPEQKPKCPCNILIAEQNDNFEMGVYLREGRDLMRYYRRDCTTFWCYESDLLATLPKEEGE